MPPQQSPLLAEVPHSPRWLGLARIFAFVSFLLILPLAFTGSSPLSWETLLFFLVLIPFWLPYLWMFFRLRGKALKSAKIGLAMAVTCGSFGAVLTLFFAAPSVISQFDWIVLTGIVFFVTQILLLTSGIVAYYSIPRAAGDFGILFRRLVSFAVMFFLIVSATIIPNTLRSKVAVDESVAVASLRTINTAQMDYAKDHPEEGFSVSLSEFGPSPGMDYIDAALAGGTKRGYVFTLVPCPPDSRGRIAKYTLTARPLTYGGSGSRNFFTDESGVIRWTPADRSATAQDNPLQ